MRQYRLVLLKALRHQLRAHLKLPRRLLDSRISLEIYRKVRVRGQEMSTKALKNFGQVRQSKPLHRLQLIENQLNSDALFDFFEF